MVRLAEILALAIVLSTLGACGPRFRAVTAQAPVHITENLPPKPRYESQQTRLVKSGREVWLRGHWEWRHKSWVWKRGRWAPERPGKVWEPGIWVQRGKRFYFRGGRWVGSETPSNGPSAQSGQ